jgi:hypothetical protein
VKRGSKWGEAVREKIKPKTERKKEKTDFKRLTRIK